MMTETLTDTNWYIFSASFDVDDSRYSGLFLRREASLPDTLLFCQDL